VNITAMIRPIPTDSFQTFIGIHLPSRPRTSL
jgi:hypothetical protein